MEYPFVHSCFFVWAITRIHRICFYILLFLLLNQYQNTWSMYLCIVDSLCELEPKFMEHALVHCWFLVWVRTRIHGVCICVLLLLFLSQNLNTWGMCLCMVISFSEPELEYMQTWSTCLCIVVSLCELELEYMVYVFVHCCFFVWVRTRIHGVCVCALLFLCVS